MEESLSGSILGKFVFAIFVLAIVDLVFLNWWVINRGSAQAPSFSQGGLIGQQANIEKSDPTPAPSPTSTSIIKKDEAAGEQTTTSGGIVANVPSPTPTTQIVIQTPYKEIFIPLGTGQTKSNSFADLNGVEINVDLSKYPTIDHTVFEASVWAEGGNGRAWAQLKNVTDANPLIESQISNPTSTPTLLSSNYVPMAQGSKLYRVQAKTDLVDYAAHVDNAHLKIMLK